jgi:MFS family permease
MSLLAGLAPTEHRGIFMSVNGMVLRTGQTLGPVVMAGVFAWGGMDRVFFVATAICLVMFFALPRVIGRERP